MRLAGKVAIISGIGRRFGQASALLFAKEGASVVLTSRRPEVIDETVEIIIEEGGKAVSIIADATDYKQVQSVSERTISEFGKINILVNNVGGSYTKNAVISEMVWSEWEETLLNNLKSIYNFSNIVIPQMRENGGGSIINIAASPKTIIDGNSAYSAAKGGVISLTKNIAYDHRNDSIRVNCICPGVIRNNTNLDPSFQNSTELKRKGNSEDIGNAILFFASDESSWITGQSLVVDGGEGLFLRIE